MGVQLHQLQSFLVTAEKSSFASAAEELFVSAPALIQQINALEKSLGFLLFDRTHKGITLTESGHEFYLEMKLIYDRYENLVERCRQIAHAEKKIRIGTYSAWENTYIFYSFFSAYREKYPDVTLEFVPITRETALLACQQKQIDVCIYADCAEAEKHHLKVTQHRCGNVGVVMSRQNELTVRPFITPKDMFFHTVYVEKAFFNDSVSSWFQQYPEICLEPIDFSLSLMQKKCKEGALFLIAQGKTPLLVPLCSRPLNPPVQFTLGLVRRTRSTSLQESFVSFFLRHEEEGIV